MKNVETKFDAESKVLTIKIDTTKSFGPSKSGKTEIVASTEGNVAVGDSGGDLRLGLNCYRFRD